MYEAARQIAGQNFHRLLKAQEERDAAIAWRDHRDEAARLLITQTHVKLVMREVRRLQGYNANPEDLFSEGLVGLTTALDKFDPDAGFRFSTYAIHWVRAMMNAHVLLTEGSAKLPSTAKLKKIFFSYRRASLDISRKAMLSGVDLTYREIQELTAKAIGASLEDLQLVSGSIMQTASMDTPIKQDAEGGDLTLMDLIEDPTPLAEEQINARQVKKHLKEDVAAAIGKLKPREQHIIAARKLVDKADIMTLEDLSQVYGVSRERIRQLEEASLKKLQTTLKPTLSLLQAA